MISSDGNMDMVIFDYLEGNFSKEQMTEFESDLTLNPDLQSELSSWKSTYLTSDFSDTSVLEKIIISKTAPFNFTFYLNMLLILCMSFISSKLPNSDPLVPRNNTSTLLVKTSLETKERMPVLFKEIPHIESPDLIKSNPNILVPIVEYIGEPENTLDQSFPFIKSITPKKNFHLSMPLIQVAKIDINPSVELRTRKGLKHQKSSKDTKKERRRTAKKRNEPEFIKGNIPYVVPISPQNF